MAFITFVLLLTANTGFGEEHRLFYNCGSEWSPTCAPLLKIDKLYVIDNVPINGGYTGGGWIDVKKYIEGKNNVLIDRGCSLDYKEKILPRKEWFKTTHKCVSACNLCGKAQWVKIHIIDASCCDRPCNNPKHTFKTLMVCPGGDCYYCKEVK